MLNIKMEQDMDISISLNGIPYSISKYTNGKEEYTGIQLNIPW
ncbi:hypothetical protein [Sporocytophaga myxococcoides]|nr:hypothetical protein [Sporocytophaga myxococcoides]